MTISFIKRIIAAIRRFFATPFGTDFGYREMSKPHSARRTKSDFEGIC